MYFARAVILAIYGDEPAAKKITLTGSGCVQCYVSQVNFNKDNGVAARVPRDRRSMKKRKRALLLMSTSGAPKCAATALEKACAAGVNLHVDNGMWGSDVDGNWVFGPDPARDNVYQNMPQVSLHGMDEGLTAKLNLGCVRAAVAEIKKLNDRPKPKPGQKKRKWWSKAAVCRHIDRQVVPRLQGLFLICTCHEAQFKILRTARN